MVIRYQCVIVIIIGQVSRCHAPFQSAAIDLHFDLALKVRFINDWNRHRSVDVFKGSDKKILTAARTDPGRAKRKYPAKAHRRRETSKLLFARRTKTASLPAVSPVLF
jgi:hypothetical protein